MKNQIFYKIIDNVQKDKYNDKNSILKEYDLFLLEKGIYRGYDTEQFKKTVANREDLIEYTLELLNKTIYQNERLFLIEVLFSCGYDRNSMVELILNEFEKNKKLDWHLCDLLRKIKNFKYLDKYIQIVNVSDYGESREMLIELLGISKNEVVIPVLMNLLCDSTVSDHVLVALTNFREKSIIEIMKKNKNHSRRWVRQAIQRYLDKI